ncbi:hypothetical protein GYB59_14390 [bacterium]|nr:hypothetical protein [bacterium]
MDRDEAKAIFRAKLQAWNEGDLPHSKMLANVKKEIRRVLADSSSTDDQKEVANLVRDELGQMVWAEFAYIRRTVSGGNADEVASDMIARSAYIGALVGKIISIDVLRESKKEHTKQARDAGSYDEETKALAQQLDAELRATNPEMKRRERVKEISEKLFSRGHYQKRFKSLKDKEDAKKAPRKIPERTINDWILPKS